LGCEIADFRRRYATATAPTRPVVDPPFILAVLGLRLASGAILDGDLDEDPDRLLPLRT
jgi:hypothetical protein